MVNGFPMKKQTNRGRNRVGAAVLCAALALTLTAPASAAYRDVPTSHWAAADIQYVSERGLFKGTGGDTFSPFEKMSRAMLATVLYRYAGSPAVSAATPYADVTAGAWYMPGVAWAYQNSIFPSVNLSRTMLYPNEDVRRAEFCVMLYNFAKSLGRATVDPAAMERAPFTDVEWERFTMAGFGPIYNEASEAMLGWAWPMGIMNGTTDTTINPLGSITRAEVSTMLARFDRNVLGGTEVTVQQPVLDAELVSTPNANSTPSTVITEESVRDSLANLKESYPSGTLYPAPYISSSNGPYGISNKNCAGWAILCSDALFGNLPWKRVNRPTWNQIRPGDLIEYDDTILRHVVVVVSKTDDYIKVTESGLNQKTRWGGQYFRWWLEEQPQYVLYSRYPS